MKNLLLIALLAISPAALASQESVTCRTQANVTRSVVKYMHDGLLFDDVYQKVRFMPFNREGAGPGIKNFAKGIFDHPQYFTSKSLAHIWHSAYMDCMPRYTTQMHQLPNGTYTGVETHVSAAAEKRDNEARYIPPAAN